MTATAKSPQLVCKILHAHPLRDVTAPRTCFAHRRNARLGKLVTRKYTTLLCRNWCWQHRNTLQPNFIPLHSLDANPLGPGRAYPNVRKYATIAASATRSAGLRNCDCNKVRNTRYMQGLHGTTDARRAQHDGTANSSTVLVVLCAHAIK